MSAELLPIHNDRASEAARLPDLSWAELAAAVESAPGRGWRVSSLFGVPEEGRVRLVALLAQDEEGQLAIGSVGVEGKAFPSMTPRCPEVHLFEREIFEQCGVRPEGHPWLKPVRNIHDVDYFRVEGEEVHEVAVGPVHAGVIEPGHFRFQCHGEQVMHLEIALGYQHRGVERALRGGPDRRTIHYAETLAGDTTVGHATAYAHVHEALSD